VSAFDAEEHAFTPMMRAAEDKPDRAERLLREFVATAAGWLLLRFNRDSKNCLPSCLSKKDNP
jgi:hypothetical protein